MRILRKVVISLIVLILIINLVTLNNFFQKSVQADVSNINIISSTDITVDNAKSWARSKGATETFVNLADLFWNYSSSNGGVNPAVAYAQSAKETNFGRFGGVIDESYHNPCGLKIAAGGDNYDPNAHKKFNSWDEGVQAQLDHLALYAGASGYPRTNTFDSRHFASIKGKSTTVVGLGGNWAPSSTYGSEIMSLYNQMLSLVTNPQSNQVQTPVQSENTVNISRGSTKVTNRSVSNNSTNENTPKIESFTNLDSPCENEEMHGIALNVTGWAINRKPITAINIYIDGVLRETATYGQARPDVATLNPDFPNAANSGFSGSVDINYLPDGKRVVKIEQVANDGTTNSIERTVVFKRMYAVSNIIAPSNKVIIDKDSITLKGWSLNANTARQINVYVDGKLLGATTSGYSRVNTIETYCKANNTNLAKLADIKTLYDTTSQQTTKEIKLVPRTTTNITDSSKLYSNINKSFVVSGFDLNVSGVKSAKVYLSGDYIVNAVIKINNPDVVIGKSELIKSSIFSTDSQNQDIIGKHTIKIEIISNDGTVTSETRPFVYGTIL